MTFMQRFQAGLVLMLFAGASVGAAHAQAVSFRKPTGMILATGSGLYFTSREGTTAHVWRTTQSATPGQEVSVYAEDGTTFGDIVYTRTGGIDTGYFFARKDTPPSDGIITIKRVPLAGGAAVDLPMTNHKIFNVDILSSHRNLVTDGVFLFWQERTASRGCRSRADMSQRST
jgi:hypothetical protein